MQVPRKAVLAVFAALEFGSAENWAPNRLQKKVDTFKDYVSEDDIAAKVKDEKLAKLARKMLAEKVEVKADAEKEEGDDNGGAADVKGEVVTTDQTDGEDEEEEEEEPAPKPKKKGGKPKADKPPKAPKPKKEKPPKVKKVSMLDAAEQVLEATGKTMTTQELIMEMDSRELWTSPNGKTPAATLYVRMLKEEMTKGRLSRFRKVGPNQFALAKNVKGKKGKSDDEE